VTFRWEDLLSAFPRPMGSQLDELSRKGFVTFDVVNEKGERMLAGMLGLCGSGEVFDAWLHQARKE
jgi:hypothetical protein